MRPWGLTLQIFVRGSFARFRAASRALFSWVATLPSGTFDFVAYILSATVSYAMASDLNLNSAFVDELKAAAPWLFDDEVEGVGRPDDYLCPVRRGFRGVLNGVLRGDLGKLSGELCRSVRKSGILFDRECHCEKKMSPVISLNGGSHDIFPLPLLRVDGWLPEGSSPRRIRRARAERRLRALVSFLFICLNHGALGRKVCYHYSVEPAWFAGAKKEVYANVRGVAKEFLRDARGLRPVSISDLFCKINVPWDDYASGNNAVAEFIDLRRISIGNPSTIGVVDALPLCSPAVQDRFRHPESCLRTDLGSEVQLPRATVMCEDDAWVELCVLCAESGLFGGIPSRDVPVINGKKLLSGAFAVPKKDGAQRLITNLIPTNSVQSAVCPTVLPYQGQFCSIVLHEDEVLRVGGEDMQNCFFVFKVPVQWRRYFCMAKSVPGWVFGMSDEEVFPCMQVVPMGWISSCGILEDIQRGIAERAGLNTAFELRSDRAVPTSSEFFSIYIDNFDSYEIVKKSDAPVDSFRSLYRKFCVEFGIPLNAKDSVISQNTDEKLGIVIDGLSGRVGVSSSRLSWLFRACLVLAVVPFAPVPAVQHALGKYTFACTSRRLGLAPTWSIFKAVNGASKSLMRLSRRVAGELLVMTGSVPFLFTNIRRRVDTRVVPTDACTEGAGIRLGTMDIALCEQVVRDFETRPPTLPMGTKVHCSIPSEIVAAPVVSVEWGSPVFDQSAKCCQGRLFRPHLLPAAASWDASGFSYPFFKNTHINVKEGHAALAYLRRASRFSESFHRRYILWLDSAVFTCALLKGRSSSFPISRILQRFWSYCAATDQYVAVSWCPTDTNPSDQDSRIFC